MRNQTSFRLTTTLLPGDMTAKTTTVINKLDSNGEKFYPSFTEETVVLTNDDRTMMETTRAICTDGVLTFIKRGLSDAVDPVTGVETEIPSRKLTWNPGSLAFITASAGDFIDKDDSITWTGNQTYTGNLVSQGSATYNGLLTTNKGVKYPSFENLEALEAYNDPFPGMFAVLESDGELYRYNAVTEQRDIVTTSTPAVPEKATTTTIGTVRGATAAEFSAGTATGSQGELLVATPAQIKGAMPTLTRHEVEIDDRTPEISTSSTGTSTKTITIEHDGFLLIDWDQVYNNTTEVCNKVSVSGAILLTSTTPTPGYMGTASVDTSHLLVMKRSDCFAVKAGSVIITYKILHGFSGGSVAGLAYIGRLIYLS